MGTAGVSFTCYFRKRQPFSDDGTRGNIEPLAIRQRAIVEPERLFIEIAEQVKRFDGNVSTLKAAL
jgi:hypothetical protein